MRRPSASVKKLPHTVPAGDRICTILHDYLSAHRCLLNVVEVVWTGEEVAFTGLPEKHLRVLRERVLNALGDQHGLGPSTEGIQLRIIEAYCSATGDPDSVLAEWLRKGAPLGVTNPIAHRGISTSVRTACRTVGA